MSISSNTQNRLANFIKTIAQAERASELMRQSLAQITLFEPYTVFRRIDQSRQGELTMSNVIEFLDDNFILYSQNELTYLFKRLDGDRDGKVGFKEQQFKNNNSFSDYILCKQDANLKQQSSMRESYFIDINMLLPSEVERAVASLFRQEILNYQSLASARDLLVNSIDFSQIECYRAIDTTRIAGITKESLTTFLNQQGVYLTPEELDTFYIAVDQNQEGKISLAQFIQALYLFESLPYQTELQMSGSRLQDELKRSRERVRELELSYPSQSPSLYQSPLERLRAERIENDLMLSRLEEQRAVLRREREEYEMQSIRRLRQLREQNLERQYQNRPYIEESYVERELRRSRDRLNQIETDSRIRLLSAERDILMNTLDRESRLRQLEIEKRYLDHQIRLMSHERLSSLDRKRRIDTIRSTKLRPEKKETTYKPQQQQTDQFGTPEKPQKSQQESIDQSTLTEEKISPTQKREVQISQDLQDKSGIVQSPGIKKSLEQDDPNTMV